MSDEKSPQATPASPPSSPPPMPPTPPRARRAWRWPAVGVALFLLAILGMYLWQHAAVTEVERRLGDEKAQVVAEKAALLKRAGEVYLEGRKDALSLFAMPLAWAVRREVIAGNLDQVDQYLTEVVKQKGFERAVLATPDGVIRVSSDRKYLGQPFQALFPAALLAAEHSQVVEPAPGRFVVVVPILGLAERQGVLAVGYAPPPSPVEP